MDRERRLIPAHQLRLGQQVFVEPQHADMPRGRKLDALDAGGQFVQVDDYIHGCVARGALLAFDRAMTPQELARAADVRAAQGRSGSAEEGVGDAS